MTGFLLQHAFLFALSFRRYSITKFWKNVALCFDASECGHVISLARESASTAGKSFPLDPAALSDATSERSLSTSAAYPNRYLGYVGGLFEHTPGPFTLRRTRVTDKMRHCYMWNTCLPMARWRLQLFEQKSIIFLSGPPKDLPRRPIYSRVHTFICTVVALQVDR